MHKIFRIDSVVLEYLLCIVSYIEIEEIGEDAALTTS